LQSWTRSFLDLVDDAHEALDQREWRAFVGGALFRLCKEAVEAELDGWRRAA
jgi:hypothetical protein